MIKQELESLRGEVYKNNFSGSQDFNKTSRFNTRLKIPHYQSIPSIGEQGEICEIGGKLYICVSANRFVVAGTQS